jgi:hypothetical protein
MSYGEIRQKHEDETGIELTREAIINAINRLPSNL